MAAWIVDDVAIRSGSMAAKRHAADVAAVGAILGSTGMIVRLPRSALKNASITPAGLTGCPAPRRRFPHPAGQKSRSRLAGHDAATKEPHGTRILCRNVTRMFGQVSGPDAVQQLSAGMGLTSHSRRR